MRPTFFATITLALSLAAPSVHALTQPDGTVIPVPRPDLRQDLQTILNMHGETTIMVQRDAAIMPATFVPDCALTFTMISRGLASFQNSFGWYNATASRPADSDLHEFIPCSAAPGASFMLNVRSDPAYMGGAIGFYMRTPQGGTTNCATLTGTGHTYYSERQYNPDNTGANSYIHLLIYDSGVTAHAFYFAWEDLFGGGDNEFTDLVTEVSGIVCTGGGASCDTGMPGICAAGTQQCHAGALTCVGTVTPRPMACNGLDNNCDGVIDDSPCPSGQVCDRGQCVPTCVEGGCFTGQTCTTRGTCVENSCSTVNCPAGQICLAGACVGACDGVTCPIGQTCRAGRCVDPCAGVTCDTDQVCENGVCQSHCQCRGCQTAQTCQSDGRCVSTGCMAVTCSQGQVCQGGTCVDACTGASCPRGQACMLGMCVAAAPTSDGGTSDASSDGASDAHSMGDVGSGGDAARLDGAVDVQSPDSGTGIAAPRHGCGCRAAGESSHVGWAWAWVACAALVLGVRRRRRWES